MSARAVSVSLFMHHMGGSCVQQLSNLCLAKVLKNFLESPPVSFQHSSVTLGKRGMFLTSDHVAAKDHEESLQPRQ